MSGHRIDIDAFETSKLQLHWPEPDKPTLCISPELMERVKALERRIEILGACCVGLFVTLLVVFAYELITQTALARHLASHVR